MYFKITSLKTLRSIIILLMFFQSLSVVDCWFSWFNSKESVPKTIDHSMGSSLGKLTSVPFEMRTVDEKFLVEAEKFGLTLSNLDVCHHKVMLHMKKSCNQLSEEEIAKLSVLLLNCQSAVEGRETYPCTNEMSLNQCTKDMDKSTWNAYHIVSNRARAVCYAARQQQFAAKAEMTVNKLMYTAEHQIDALQKIEDGQVKVKELTSQTLETMHTGQRELVERQEKLKTSQQTIQAFVSGNLRELTREKALIAAGQKELSLMTEMIQKKLDEASQTLSANEAERQSNHQDILTDLARVQLKAKEMWEKIDNSTQRILTQHAETSVYYHETLLNLERINNTVTYLLQLVDQTRAEVDARLGWLSGILHGAGDKLSVIYCCVVHGMYFLVAAVTATFLQVPSLSRIFMSFLIPINALCDVNQAICLDFSSLTVILVLAILAHCLVSKTMHKREIGTPRLIQAITNDIRSALIQRFPSVPQNGSHRHMNGTYPGLNVSGASELLTPDVDVSNISQNSALLQLDLSQMAPTSNTPGTSTPRARNRSNSQTFQTNVLQVKRDLTSILENDASTRSRSSTPNRTISTVLENDRTTRSRSSTPNRVLASPRRLCSGLKRSGSPCRSSAAAGKDFCRRHDQVS